jgi:formylmethanofuran dehydrogenase subunit D
MIDDHTGSAKALMNNEAFKEAIAKTQQAYLNAAMACALNDADGQRLNLQAARIVATVGAHIAALATDKGGDVIELPDFYAERARKKFLGIL